MDAFYASIHIRDDPSLQGKPVVVGGDPSGRGVVAAASYEARRFGLHSAMPAARARRLCPHAVFVRSDFSRYRRESEKVFEIFRRFTPVIEPLSVDEAFLDVTDHLEPYGSATALARAIREQVREERRLTVSVGVGPNKLVAKIASDHDKPDGLTVVPPDRVRRFLDPLPARCIPGVGPATDKALRRLGVHTIAELAALPLDALARGFGKHGQALHEYARGRDERPVRTTWKRKSLGKERTFRHDLHRLGEMEARLDELAEEVARGLRQREIAGCTVTLKVRYQDFTTLTRAHSLRLPTRDAALIARQAKAMLRERTEARDRPVRLLGVTVSALVRDGEPSQLWLFEEDT